MEDYLEVIYELVEHKGYVTTIDITKSFRKRHGLLAEFLKIIGVDEDTANKDAEGIEHHLHPKTLEKLEYFIEDIKKKR